LPLDGMAESIFLIRHAEKPDAQAGIAGVTLTGDPDPQTLSVRGWQRAGALAVLFGRPQAPGLHTLLAPPTELVAAVDAGRSNRPYDTLRPLAELLGLPIREMPSSGDMRPAAARISAVRGHVLVSWRHRELPILARALLPRSAHLVPLQWDKARFDLVWVIRANELTVVPQHLLAGDLAIVGQGV
jgi:hypothetical protein